ncbi:reticulon-like protein B21 [Solanum dulcamara]|uniref:reticulon-like protein B21 n=1 Tax=Solanum dulcamara TaxID=45834 RepID=UPI0024853D89|nr:reticulon-like protein B21 [Solanum dulcamara]
MEVASRRKGKISRNGVVVAGSIWENRMRFDEFKGGINVYSEKEETPKVENDEKTNQVEEDKKMEMGSKTNLGVGSFVMSGKRKTCKSKSNFEGTPIQLSTKRSELCKELSVSAMKNSPIQSKKKEGNEKMSELRKVKNRKAKSEKCKELDGNSKNSNVIEENKVVVDESKKNLERVFGESSDRNEENKVVDVVDESKKNLEMVFSESSDGNEENKVVDELKKNLEREFGESSDRNEENKVVDVLDESKKNLERVFGESSDGNEENKVVDVLDESKKNLERVFEESTDGNEENKVVDVLDESKKNLKRVFSESSDGNEENKVVDVLDESKKNLERECGESSDENEENKVVVDVLDESKKNLDGNEGNQIQLRKVKSEANKAENVDGKNEKNCDLRKVKSVCLNGNLRNSLQMVKTKSDKCNKSFEENKVVVVLDESKKKNLEGSFERKSRLEENCEEKVITSNNVEIQERLNLENEDLKILEEEIEKEINLAEKIKTKKIVIVEEKKVHINNNEKRAMPISPIIKKQSPPPVSGQSRIHHHPSPSRTKPVPPSDESQRNIPRQHSKLESLVDLVMWRDSSKSALIFGIGTFFIISSSYTQDLNISFISVISYLGLVYLATIFLFRSLRGANDICESSEYVLGEEEAMWILKLILPYINEFLMKIRALFSGDPATTMKMAILLFILARCGSSITIWKMSKLGFFGVFIIPKACSSYSTQLTAYGTFWIRRFRDAWETCTHKKAVAFAIFTLIWNLSSISARIWAVFMLYVGFRYYQQKMMKEGWIDEEEITKSEDYWQEKIRGQRRIGRKATLMESKKQKKTI